MLISDTLMMLCLVGFCVGWFACSGRSIPSWLWLLPTVAIVASAIGVFQGRWQAALGACVAAVMLLCLLIRWRRRRARTKLRIISTGLLIATTMAAYAPLYLMPIFHLPKPTGPHPVGVRTFELEDDNRLGVMEAADDQARRILLRAWYPADQAGESVAPYASAAELEVTFAGLASQIGMPSFFFSHLGLVNTNSYENAAVLKGETPLPVVFFSHGYMSYASQNTVLMESLASHGYLVIAMAHPYDAAPVLFSDGSVIARSDLSQGPPRNDQGDIVFSQAQAQFYSGSTYDDRYEGMLAYFAELREQDDRLLHSARTWLDDRLFVTETLASGAAPTVVQDLIQRADFSRVAHMGMSFGGSTSGGACFEDPRCVAAVNLDGGDYHSTPVNRDAPVPLLMFHSDWHYFDEFFGDGQTMDLSFGFNDFSYENHSRAGLREDLYRLRVKDVRHIGISDYPLMLREPLSSAMVGSIDPETMMEIVNDFVLGFLDRHLRNIQNDFPESEFASHADDVVPHDASKVRTWWQTKSLDEIKVLEKRLADVFDSKQAVSGR